MLLCYFQPFPKNNFSFTTKINLENYNITKLIHFLSAHEQHACSNYRKCNNHKRADYQLRCCQSNSERRATVIHVAAQSYLPIQLANNPGKHFEVNIVPTLYLHSRKKALWPCLHYKQAGRLVCKCVCVCVCDGRRTLTWSRRREWWPRPGRWWQRTPGRIGWVGRSGKERRWPRHLPRLPRHWNLAWQEEGGKGGWGAEVEVSCLPNVERLFFFLNIFVKIVNGSSVGERPWLQT